jgi:hypothetical protein
MLPIYRKYTPPLVWPRASWWRRNLVFWWRQVKPRLKERDELYFGGFRDEWHGMKRAEELQGKPGKYSRYRPNPYRLGIPTHRRGVLRMASFVLLAILITAGGLIRIINLVYPLR